MASGAWGKALWTASAISRAMGGGDAIDTDPYRVMETSTPNVMPYNPAVLKAVQEKWAEGT